MERAGLRRSRVGKQSDAVDIGDGSMGELEEPQQEKDAGVRSQGAQFAMEGF